MTGLIVAPGAHLALKVNCDEEDENHRHQGDDAPDLDRDQRAVKIFAFGFNP
jgi:hypothetical protein